MFSEKIGEWKKIIAGAAVFGFILSLFNGLIGRVSFGMILLRAFLFAAAFSAVSIAILMIIDYFIPELLSSENNEEDSEISDTSVIIEEGTDIEQPVSGKNLDITIEDDGVEPVEELEEFDGEVAAKAPDSGSKMQDDFGFGDAEEAEAVEVAEAVEPGIPEAQAAEPEPERNGAPNGKKNGKNGRNGDLPDIGAFSGSFEASEGTETSEGLSSIDGAGTGGAEILGGMHETQEIVKAVKTVLKKDQEG